MGQNNFILDLIAGLQKAMSKRQINTDIKSLGDFYINLIGNLDLSKTIKHVRNQLKGTNITFNITPNLNTKGVQNAMKQSINTAQKVANKNKIHYSYTFDMDKKKFQNELKIFSKENSKLFSDKSMSMKYSNLVDSAGVAKSKSEINALRKELSAFKTELIACNKMGMNWTDKFKASISHFAQYFSGASFIYAVTNQLKEAWTSAKTIDDKLVDLQKVTDSITNRDALYNYFDKAMSKAQELNVKVGDLIDAVTEFKKLGWSLPNAESGGKWATILQNVGDVDIETAIGSIKTSIASFDKIGGYGSDQMDKKLEAYVDLINNMSNKYGIDAEGLSEAIRLSAGTLTEAHTSIEQAAAMFSKANEYYNDPSYLGNTVKIGSLRMRASKGDKTAQKDLEDMGEEVENLSGATSKLRQQLLSLTGVDIMKDKNGKTFKSYYDQLKEIADVIDQLDDTSRANVLETLFGKSRAAGGAAILSGLKEGAGAYQDAINSAGSSTEEYTVWLQSADAATQRFSNDLVQTYQQFINGNTIRDLANLGSAILEFANKFGIIEGTLKAFLALKISQFISTGAMAFFQATKQVEQYGKALQTVNNIPNGNLAQRFSSLKSIAIATESLTDAQLKQVLSSKTLTQQDRIRILMLQGTSREIALQKLEEMGLTQATNAQTTATNTQTASTFSLKAAMTGLGATIRGLIASNPLGIALMAISIGVSAVTSVVSSHNQKMEEMRQKAKEAADQANTTGDEIASLTGKYLSLSEAVKKDKTAKEELMSTQDELMQKLGLEGQTVDDLIKKYGSLDEAIKQSSLDSLKKAENDLIAGVNSAKAELIDIGKSGFFDDKSMISAGGSDAVKAFKALEKAGVVDKGSFGSGGGALILSGDDSTVEGILANYKKLEDAMNALRDSNAFTTEELINNSLYKEISDRYNEMSESVKNYKDSITNLNENLAQQTMLTQLQGKDLPKSKEEFNTFRQELIDTAIASKQFIGNEKDITEAINGYLSTVPQFEGYYSVPLKNEVDKTSALLGQEKDSIISFSDAWSNLKNSSDEATKDLADNLTEMAQKGQLTTDKLLDLDKSDYFKNLGISAEEATKKINALVDSSDQLSAMSSQISKMSDMLADKKNGVTADASDLAGFDVTVKGLDSWNEFERVMGSSTSTIAECKKAANALATEWVNSNNFLAQLTDENKDYYITQLNNMGVENAEAVVTAFLTKKREEEALATEYSNAATAYNSSVKDQNKKITTDLTNVTGVEIQRLKSEGIISADTAEKMRLLAVKKAMANGVTLNTTADIQNLADLAGASTKLGKLLNRLTDIKRGFTNGMPSDVAEIQAEDLQKQIEALINGGSNTPKIDPIKIDINGSSNYTPPKTTTSKDKTTKQKTKPTAQIFDFIETRLNKLTKAAEKAKSKIDELFNRKSKNNQIDKAIKATTTLINAQYKAAKRYQAYADKMAGKAKKTTKQTVKISDSTGKAIVSSAKKYVGKLDYVWGGSSLVSGADCSGFTQQIYKKNGINIARTAQEQYNTTKGTKITNKSKLKPGDLLYFGTGANNITHTGIYAGNGKFIHSPHKGKKVSISNLSDRKDFVGGVRANALNKTTTKTYKIKGLSNSTVQKYIKLIENGSLDKDAIKSIKNDKLKQFIQEYSDYYQKAQEAIEKAKELEKERNEFKKDKLQSYVDEAQTYIDKYNTQIELAPGAVTKNNLEQKKLKYVKQSYDYQIKIAQLEKDSLKVAQLRVEKEKALLEIKKEIRQNSLDQIDKDETLLDAQYKNATSTKSKNSILQKENKQNDKKVTANKNYYNSVNKDFTSKGKTASSSTTKAKSLSDSDRKKINSYIKQGKTIPKSLLKKVKSVDSSLYNSLVNYNKKYDDNSSIMKSLDKSKISKKTKDNIKKAISSGKTISKSMLNAIKKKDPELYKKLSSWNKEKPNRDSISKKVSANKTLTSSDKKKIQSLIKSKKRIPSDLMKKVKAANPGLYKQLLEYNRYYDYTKDAKYDWDLSKEESKSEKRENFKEQFDNIQTEHERRVAKINDEVSATENDISLIEAKGGKASETFYQGLSDLSNKSKTELEKEYDELEKKLKDGLANGTIQEGTDEWYEMVDAISEVKKNIDDATLSQEQYLQKVRETHFEVSQHARDAISALNDEADFYKEILGYKKMYDKAGNLTDEGKSTMGLSLTKMNNFVVLNKKINEDLKENEELFKSNQIGYDEYIERKNNLISQQRDVIKGCYSEIEAIKNLINQGYDKQKDALSDLINKYKKALSAEKELHDYEKNVKDQTKNIDSLKKRIAALQGNETEEARQKISQLTVSLKDAEENLQETQYDKYISDQEDILDDLQDSYEKFIEEEIDNLDETVQNFIKSASEDASMINDTLETIAEIAEKWGVTISDLINPEGAYDYDKKHSTNDSTNIDNTDYVKGGSSGSAVNPNPERVIARNKFNDFMNNNKSDSYTSKDLDNLLPIQKLILAYSGGKLYYGQDKLSKLLDTLGTNNPSVAANMFSTAFGTSISDADNAVNKIKNDTQQKEAYERDEKVRTEAEKKVIEESKKRDAKLNKLKEIDEFLNDHVDEASLKQDEYGALNQYIYGKTGGKVLSKANEKQLAKILGVKLSTDLTGKEGAKELTKIRDALKNAGFSTGGAIEGNTSGDTLLLRAARKERVLTPEQNKNWEKWTDAIPSVVGLADYLPKFNIPDVSKFNGGDNVSIGDINIKLDGSNVTDADSLIKELQNSNKLRECIQDISINARRGNKLSIMKY